MSNLPSVRTGVGTDRSPDLSSALAEAFQDDPVMGWLLPDPERRVAALRRFFALECEHIALPHGACIAASDIDIAAGGPERTLGAALVLPPGRWRMPVRAQAGHAPEFLRIFGRRLPHALGLLAMIERRHPRQPHRYLAYLGVAPAAQGLGVGTALLTAMLERSDREGLPAYLEASSPRNAQLYRRLGFETLSVVRPFGAPPMELMIREPQP
jgi:GNAT superfamily N-acetyltransferase